MDRLIDIDKEEMWTDFLEEVNKLLHEEKVARHENDAVKVSEICQRIVNLFQLFYYFYYLTKSLT